MGDDGAEAMAWLELQQTSADLRTELDKRLQAGADMSAADYDVLWAMSNAVDRRLTMSELADRARLTRSGATRLVDRLVARGWVTRVVDDANRRLVLVELTSAGAQATRAGFLIARRTRHELLGDRLTAGDVTALRRLLGKLGRRLDLLE